MKIYFLSGLGADSRVFKYLTFPPTFDLIFLDWLIPGEKESLQDYAKRMSAKIDSTEPFILVGLSFGGILACEMLEFIKPQKTILISSAANRRELSWFYRLAGVIKLNKLIPKKAANSPNNFTYWMFGISTKRDKGLLKEILTSTNSKFSIWAVNALLNWKRKKSQPGLIRIHGDKDKVLPIINFKPDYLVKNGGHFMVVNKAAEISNALATLIGSS